MGRLRNFILLYLGLQFASVHGRAQNILDNKVYKVTAYKVGDHSITSTSNYAEVIPPISIFIPSAFTPNGDGLNDTFGVKGEGISEYHLYVYDRWGEVIFESSNPKSNWDGNYKGKPAEQGVYVYQVFASGLPKKGKTGSVSLVY